MIFQQCLMYDVLSLVSPIPFFLHFFKFVFKITRTENLSYIGFSQGTALAFGAFSRNKDLARRIKVFIALAPSTTVRGFQTTLVNSLAKTRPELLFLIFGKRAFLSPFPYWRSLLPRDFLVYWMDVSQRALFGWTMQNLDESEKKLLYSHLYSTGSVKTLVHWFQIIRHHKFQMFDDTHASSPSDRTWQGSSLLLFVSFHS